jgi:DNA-binding NarL/FixJ family response regulator
MQQTQERMTAHRDAQAATVVCLVEHNPLAAAHLRQLLSSQNGLTVCTHEEMFQRRSTRREPAPIFVLDRTTLPTALSKYLRTLRLRFPDARIIVLDEPLPNQELCRLLVLGIQGFLPYPEVDEHLPEAILTVAGGQLWMEGEVLEQYVSFSSQLTRSREDRGAALTKRERRILELVQRRLSNKEISTILDISESTVKFHIGNIFTKLGVHDRQAAAELLSSRGLRALQAEKAK